MTPASPRARSAPRRARSALSGCALSGCALTVLSPLALDYVVQPGDTVSQIATGHDTTVERLVETNDLRAGGDRIYAGEVLRLPAAHAPGHRSASASTSDSTSDSGGAGRRRTEWHRVAPGDTMTGIAERYHAWTDELIDANGGDEALVVGERLEVPVVVARAGDAGAPRTPSAPRTTAGPSAEVQRVQERLSGYPDPVPAKVRRIIERTARREGVNPNLALAVSWQEAGWQQHHVSPDTAIGAMQVIPTTGDWVSGMVGRDLELVRVRDNVTAGVVLLDHLTAAAHTRRAVAGYYQGLSGVRRHGMYDDTRAYVDNVLALKRAFARGDHPG